MLRSVRAFAPGIIGFPPLIVAACLDRSRAARPEESERGEWDDGLLCVAMTVRNLLLSAHALARGGCPVAGFHQDAVHTLPALPPHLEPLLLVPIGHPARASESTPRRVRGEVIHHESW